MLGVKRLAFVVACLTLSAVAGVLSVRRPVGAFDEGRPVQNAATQRVPPYPGARFFAMGGPVHVDGKVRELAYAESADSPAKVAAHYAAVWTSQGLRVEERDNAGERWVVAQDAGELFSVAAVPRDQGSLVIASQSAVFGARATRVAPLPSGCRALGRTGGLDAGVRTELVFVQCEGRLDDVRRFYDGALPGATTAVQEGDGGRTMRWTEGRREALVVGVEELSPTPRVAFTLSWQEGP